MSDFLAALQPTQPASGALEWVLLGAGGLITIGLIIAFAILLLHIRRQK